MENNLELQNLNNVIVEILTQPNLQNNEVELSIKTDEYSAVAKVEKLHIPDLFDLTHGVIVDIIIAKLKADYGYIQKVDEWKEPDWEFSTFVKTADLTTILSDTDCIPIIASLIASPPNPCYKHENGCEYFLAIKDQNMIALLASKNIILDFKERPII